jgi:hypothetical protein
MKRVYVRDLPDQSDNLRTGWLYLTDQEYNELIHKELVIRWFDEVLHIEDRGPTIPLRYSVHIETSETEFRTLNEAELYLFDWDQKANDSGRKPPLRAFIPPEYFETGFWKQRQINTDMLCHLYEGFCRTACLPRLSADELLYELEDHPHAQWAEPFLRKFCAVWQRYQDAEDEAARPVSSYDYVSRII